MNKPVNAKDLAEDILKRSTCLVQVGAAITDGAGIFSWGWNSAGPDGYGMCAEAHAISRANKNRLFGAVICIAGRRNRNGKIVVSKPCEKCRKLILKWKLIAYWRNKNGEWQV